MLFNSYIFILFFLPISLSCYFLLNKQKLTLASKAWLVLASLGFYSWWNVKYLPLILGSIFFNYAFGTSIQKLSGPKRKLALISGICSNLALLGYFKYADFFISNLKYIMDIDIELLHIVLPLGISFFTFTQIAYLVDTYKSKAKEYDFLNYSLFVTFFSHLLAGPIIHHKEMMPQFEKVRSKVLNYKNLSLGAYLFVIGMFKKVGFADYFAQYANSGFNAGTLTFFEGWVTSLSYTFQLYFDFSGYTDMALGSALMFNIRLPENFNSPYKSLNIQEFWRRWHITLSRFLRDYIYIPLGGNRVHEAGICFNLMITFIIGGLWHGAGWTFVLWGLLHGVAIVCHRLWKKTEVRMPKLLAWVLTFNFINITWVFFRANSLPDALKVLKSMMGLSGIVLPIRLAGALKFLSNYKIEFGDYLKNIQAGKETIPMLVLFLLISVFIKNSNEISAGFRPSWRTASFAVLVLILDLMLLNKVSEFLYFNF